MDNINIYNNSAIILSKKTPKSIVSWISILFVLLILLIIFFSIPFNIYNSLFGYITIKDNDSYLVLSLDKSDFPMNKNDKLYIKSDKYDYEVIDIDNNKVILKIDLKEEIKLDNNTVIVNLLSNRTTVFEILKNKIKKGFGL